MYLIGYFHVFYLKTAQYQIVYPYTRVMILIYCKKIVLVDVIWLYWFAIVLWGIWKINMGWQTQIDIYTLQGTNMIWIHMYIVENIAYTYINVNS